MLGVVAKRSPTMSRSGAWRAVGSGLVLLLLVSPPALAQTSDARGGSLHASFAPPLNTLTNELTYLFGAGFYLSSSPIRVLGLQAGAGGGFGSAPAPRLGYEAGLTAAKGGGDLSLGLPVELGGPKLQLDLVQLLGSFTLKYHALQPGEEGWLGLTIYGGAQTGFQQVGMSNALGTAYRHYALWGGIVGAVVQLFFRPWVDVELFGGGRAVGTVGGVEAGDKDPSFATGMLSPDVGGDITVHLPLSLDLSLSTLVNWLEQSDKKQRANSYVLGLSWRAGEGFSPVVDEAKP